jgi:hypothetical protein
LPRLNEYREDIRIKLAYGHAGNPHYLLRSPNKLRHNVKV